MLSVLLNNDDERFPPCRFADGAALDPDGVVEGLQGVLMVCMTDDDVTSFGEVSGDYF